jgi:hypothetical protein
VIVESKARIFEYSRNTTYFSLNFSINFLALFAKKLSKYFKKHSKKICAWKRPEEIYAKIKKEK